MENEILFRAKSLEGNKWVYGSYLFIKPFANHQHFIVEYRQGKEIDYTTDIKIIPETLGQFSGVIDFNGKKIFSGDIIEVLSIEEEIKTLELYYDEELCSFQFRNDWEPFCRQFGNDYMVIGNIYDNPELLKSLK